MLEGRENREGKKKQILGRGQEVLIMKRTTQGAEGEEAILTISP